MREAERAIDEGFGAVARDQSCLAIALDRHRPGDGRGAIAADETEHRAAAAAVERDAAFGEQVDRQSGGLPVEAQRRFRTAPGERSREPRRERDATRCAQRIDAMVPAG
ncbi:hypothetical protein WR25_17526 [Diploscapter pachys]|uniref:Uncharacterized protein n=1 Tax=Diploscapter pachys TaxID=2018661 RepID=A0A2A2K757_9BILA|nr:hypothetical protein WR25_17526 [Diploscapter pachys]